MVKKKVGLLSRWMEEREGAHTTTEDCLPDAPFSLPFSSSSSSSSSSVSALTFVSTSSKSYLLEAFVGLTSPLRSVLLREVETVQSGSHYASKAGWGQGVGRQTHGAECQALAAGAGSGNSLIDGTPQTAAGLRAVATLGEGVFHPSMPCARVTCGRREVTGSM